MVAGWWWPLAAWVEIIGGLLALLVLAESALITGFSAANLLEPAGGRDPARARVVLTGWAQIDRPALGLLLVAGAFAFIGFETTAAYGGGGAASRRAVGRSAYAAVVGDDRAVRPSRRGR